MGSKNIVALLTITLTATSLVLFVLFVPAYLEEIINFATIHPVLAPFLVIIWRILAIIIPPLPGGVVSFALLPAFGWFWSFIFAAIGMLIGTSIAFYLARRFRLPLVKKFLPLQELNAWESRLSERTEFLGFLALRMTTGPVMDFISYVAGLSNITYRKFILATAISLVPDAFIFFAGEELYKNVYKKNTYWNLVALVIFMVVAYVIYKSRFFKKL